MTFGQVKPTTDWGTLSVYDSINGKIHYYGGMRVTINKNYIHTILLTHSGFGG